MQDVTKHTGRILMQVASSFSNTVVLAPDWNMDALFLLGNLRKWVEGRLKPQSAE